MKNRYYHGLAGGIPFWEEQAVLEESLRSLKFILAYGGIYCRRILNDLGIEVYNAKAPVYNGDDYISICSDNPSMDEFTGDNSGLDSSFFRYVKTKIAIELKTSIEQQCVFREEPYKHLPAERQVYESIDISNFLRILVGFEDLTDRALYELRKICELYGISVMSFKELEQNTIKYLGKRLQ